MTTRFNGFNRLARGTINVAIGIAAVTFRAAPAGETPFEKLGDLAPIVVARSGSIAVGISSNGFILVSWHGDDWRRTVAPAVHFRGVCYGAGKFVAVGYAGAVASSPDGSDWTQIPSPTVCSLYSIAFGNKKFVAIGNEGAILRSSDAIRWKSVDITETRLRGIAFGNGTFVAVGYEGLILSSHDGAHWTFGDAGSTDRLESIAFGNGRFVAVGWKGTIVSGDRDHWNLAHLPGRPRLLRVVYQGDTFHTFSEHGLSMSSADGLTWQPVEVTSSQYERTIAFSGQR